MFIPSISGKPYAARKKYDEFMFINDEEENIETDTIRDHLVTCGHSVKVGREGNEGEGMKHRSNI